MALNEAAATAAAEQANTNCRVFLINEQRLVREAMRVMVDTSDGFEVVGEAAGGAQALELLNTTRPDLVATDLPLPERTGVRFVGELLARWPQVAIVVLGGVSDVHHIRATMRAGARGYVHNASGRAGLLRTLREVAAGRRCPGESNTAARRRARETNTGSAAPVNLTERQLDVLRLVALGYRNKEIAHQLGVSVKAVQHHRARLCVLLNLQGTAALTLYAIRTGLVGESLGAESL